MLDETLDLDLLIKIFFMAKKLHLIEFSEIFRFSRVLIFTVFFKSFKKRYKFK